MDCGGETWCEVSNFLQDNSLFVTETIRLIQGLLSGDSSQALQSLQGLSILVRDNFANIVSIAIGALGIFKWWHYREKILHLRLAEYLADQDRRLISARDDLLTAINRPGPARGFSEPLFADKRLKRVLRERRWEFDRFGEFVTRSVNSDLNDALARIERRIETSRDLLQNFQNQRVSVHLLRGAVAAAEASRPLVTKSSSSLDNFALVQFRTALQVPGFENDVLAKELEGHQLRKLQQFNEARQAYECVIWAAQSEKDDRKRELTIARCRQFVGDLHQINALEGWLDGNYVNGGSTNAVECYRSAIESRHKFGPFEGWEALDQAILYFAIAYAHCRLGNTNEEPTYLEKSRLLYIAVLSDASFFRSFLNERIRRLRKAAKRGLNSLDHVTANDASTYNVDWLLPAGLAAKVRDKHSQDSISSSNQPKNDTQAISPSSSYQGIAKAPN